MRLEDYDKTKRYEAEVLASRRISAAESKDEVRDIQFEVDGRAFAQGDQHVQQRERLLAAGQADHHAVARADHVEVADRAAGVALQALGQLVLRGGFAGRNHPRILRQTCIMLVR